ncbi:nicotinate-nucleotide adenylyltransferase [soil metagenome]
MGGTFDPIHNGHLVAASEVADRFGLDEVVFVPTGEPWQKHGRYVTAAEDRYLMTVIATASNPRFSVSRVDIDRGGKTYTKDTLRDLQALNPNTDLYFITGADALASILSWQNWEELFSMARFVGVSRPGFELNGEHIAAAMAELAADALTLVEIPALAISSTDCRRRAAQNHPIWYLVPDGVVQYVSKRHLYGAGTDSGTDKGLLDGSSSAKTTNQETQ